MERRAKTFEISNTQRLSCWMKKACNVTGDVSWHFFVPLLFGTFKHFMVVSLCRGATLNHTKNSNMSAQRHKFVKGWHELAQSLSFLGFSIPSEQIHDFAFLGSGKPWSCKPRSWKFCRALPEVTFAQNLLPEGTCIGPSLRWRT